VSDLYHETAEPEPASDASSYQQYETAEPADLDYGEYTETDAEVRARIADQDELPTPEESRQATWGDNPDYYDETEFSAEYDGDLDAFLAGEDELPTPQESRARTWGDNPDYYDETDLTSEYDGDLDAITTEGDDPAGRHTLVSPDAEDTHARSPTAPEAQDTPDPSTDAEPVRPDDAALHRERPASRCHRRRGNSRRWKPSVTKRGRRSRT
jgi:hypothetical protein